MASLVSNSNNAFTRSHSSSDIPKLITFDFERPEPAIGIEELTRSASYTCLSVLESDSYFPLKDYLAADVAPAQPEKVSRSAYKLVKNGESKAARPQDERPNLDRLGRRQSLVAGPRSWLQRVKSSPERKATLEREPHVTQPPIPIVTTYSRHKSTTSESFVNFASRSWVSSSRSPSPGTSAKIDIDDRSLEEDDSTAASSISSSSPPKSFVIPVNLDNVSPGKSSDNSIIGFGKKSSGLLRKSKRPQVEYADNSSLRSVTLLGNSSARGSIENFDSPRGSTEALPVSTLSKDKLSSLGIEATHRKDELWSVFRALEIDFQKFHAKPSALRTNVVRSTLLPFFRNYAQHPSIKNLRPEDLDRRVNILNKWWRGLLEMLDGHHSQSVSGTDRPVVLDAIIGIMTRPEWRLAPSYVPPLNDRSTLAGSPLVRTRSSGTLDWTTSQSLAESVYHNVRNKFIHNLESQMSMVVEKMSLRHAPASLVTFCGKAVAYAFFFCPGVADILVRLWKTPLETIRRVADEFGLVRRVSNNSSHDDVVAEFPPSLHVLGWTSSKALAKHLRHSTDLPPKGAKIPWHGPWATRWCGRDSDLFFVFCKHYHILMEDFLPPDAPLIVKARAPGFVLVHAQILKVLDGTIHRHSSSDAGNGSNSLNFDDVLSGLDASAAALPRPPGSNVARHMAENRLIMLLRDFISERASDFVSARHTFAEAFGNIARASAKRTSLYDHNGCFILCDFLEEALGIYMKFQHANPDQNGYIDWRFWLDVCRKVLVSQNSMSEIRLFSFIFGSWSTIEADERRKEILCVEWLLSADVFQEYFLHWCPMVRAYYMRLLCWRVCRFDGEASQLNT